MGIRGELFTTQIQVENRTYFFNVKENRVGDVFLQIVESKSTDGAGFDRHAIVIFEEEMQTFLQGLNQSLEFVEKNRKERLKQKHKILERKPSRTHFASDRKNAAAIEGTAATNQAKKPPRKVHVIKKEPSV
ncbi:MAG: PUR family DNA/RNA-binding protein [Treponema sp.]